MPRGLAGPVVVGRSTTPAGPGCCRAASRAGGRGTRPPRASHRSPRASAIGVRSRGGRAPGRGWRPRRRARRSTAGPGAGGRGRGTPRCCRCRRAPGWRSRTRSGRPGRRRPWPPRRRPGRRRPGGRRRPRRRGGRRCATPRWRRRRRRAGAARPGTSRWAGRTAGAPWRSRRPGRPRRAWCRRGRRDVSGQAEGGPARSSVVGDEPARRRPAPRPRPAGRGGRTGPGEVDRAPAAAGRATAAERVAAGGRHEDQGRRGPCASTATQSPAGVPVGGGRRARRSGAAPPSRARRPGGAPARRRSSAARVGPRKAASARPRPSSSATMATSTPEAQRAPSSVAVRSSRQPAAATAASSLAARSASSSCADGVGAEPVDDLGGRVAQRPLLGREADVHQSSSPAGRAVGAPLVAERAAQHLARREPGDGVDHDDVAQVLVGGQRVGHELLELAVGRPGRSGSSCTAATGTSPGPLVGDAEHGAVERRPGGRAAPPRPRPGATWKPFTLIISLDRSVRWTHPSGSSQPTSPVRYQPSAKASALASSGR